METGSETHSVLTVLFLSLCRPYFELKAKYYLQLEVRQFLFATK